MAVASGTRTSQVVVPSSDGAALAGREAAQAAAREVVRTARYGGADGKTLYITAQNTLYRMELNTQITRRGKSVYREAIDEIENEASARGSHHQHRKRQQTKRRGARLIAIDPFRSDTAIKCDQHIALYVNALSLDIGEAGLRAITRRASGSAYLRDTGTPETRRAWVRRAGLPMPFDGEGE